MIAGQAARRRSTTPRAPRLDAPGCRDREPGHGKARAGSPAAPPLAEQRRSASIAAEELARPAEASAAPTSATTFTSGTTVDRRRSTRSARARRRAARPSRARRAGRGLPVPTRAYRRVCRAAAASTTSRARHSAASTTPSDAADGPANVDWYCDDDRRREGVEPDATRTRRTRRAGAAPTSSAPPRIARPQLRQHDPDERPPTARGRASGPTPRAPGRARASPPRPAGTRAGSTPASTTSTAPPRPLDAGTQHTQP